LGRVPSNVPKINWEIVRTNNDTTVDGHNVVMKKLLGHADNSGYPDIKVDIDLTVVTPKNAKGPAPMIMEFMWRWPAGTRPTQNNPVSITAVAAQTWQSQVLEKGWGYAQIVPITIQPDNGAGLTQGIIGLT